MVSGKRFELFEARPINLYSTVLQTADGNTTLIKLYSGVVCRDGILTHIVLIESQSS